MPRWISAAVTTAASWMGAAKYNNNNVIIAVAADILFSSIQAANAAAPSTVNSACGVDLRRVAKWPQMPQHYDEATFLDGLQSKSGQFGIFVCSL